MSTKRQAGFSLLELMVALMIIAVIATLGFKQLNKNSSRARRVKAFDQVKTVSEALDQYYLRHGVYPDFGSYENMVDPGSVLVKENFLPTNVTPKDPWNQAYEARSTKGTYFFRCLGDPADPEDPDRGWFTREPSKIVQAGDGNAGAAAPTDAAAGTTK